MQTRKEETENCCPITTGMWKTAISCTEEINKNFGDCINDKDSNGWCFVLACASGGTFPLGFCAAWLVCCSLPPVTAAAVTPLTGLLDCGIFSFNKISHCANGPERQVMNDTGQERNRSKQYGTL